MKILFVRGVAGYGGAEGRYLRMQRCFLDRGIEAHLFWFAAGDLLADIPADQPSHLGSLADAAELVADGGFDRILCVADDFDVGAGALHELAGARLFVNVAGNTSFRWPASRCTALIAVARWLQEAQRAQTDAPVELVYNGVDTELFCPGEPVEVPDRPVIAWVGNARKLEQKRIDRLAAAAPALTAQGFAIWVISPSGPETVPAELAAALRPHTARWEGLPLSAMAELYRSVAASGGGVLSTCDWEGLSNAMLEAQACGCPVITTDVRGANEAVLPAHGGVLYPPELPGPALAERIGGLLREPGGQARRGAAARAMVLEQFSVRSMIDGYLRLFERATWPRRHDRAAWRNRIRAWAKSRQRGSYPRRTQEAMAEQYSVAAAGLAARRRGDLAAHLRRRARDLAPWRR